MRVLINFHHGLGDAVQLTSVLAHLRHYHAEWQIDAAALLGKHSALRCLTDRLFVLDRSQADPSEYERVYDLDWWECGRTFPGLPATKAEKCLVEVFGLTPLANLCRYRVDISARSRQLAANYLQELCGKPRADGRYRAVLMHYQGNTSQEHKNLDHQTARNVCEQATAAGYVPIILDWDRRSPLPGDGRIFCPSATHWLWGNAGTGDAEVLAALIDQCALFVGIDSGPQKVAAATHTPAIAVWNGHHPLHYHAPADNVLHLVTQRHADLIRGDRSEGECAFADLYRYRTYSDVWPALSQALEEVLGTRPRWLIHHRGFAARRDYIDQDGVVMQDVFEHDAYSIDHLPLPREIVVDIGAHLGCFAARWRQRNHSARIICVEACPENIDALQANVGAFAEVVFAACTYEEGPQALLNSVFPGGASTGGSRVVPAAELNLLPTHRAGRQEFWRDARPLPAVTLEELLQRYALKWIDVLKLDCEGAEFSILRKCQPETLARIKVIVGEYHGSEAFRQLVSDRFATWTCRLGSADQYGNDSGPFWLFNDQFDQAAASAVGNLAMVGRDRVSRIDLNRTQTLIEPVISGKDRAMERSNSAAAGTSVSPVAPSASRPSNLVRHGEFWLRADNVEQDLVIVRDVFEQDAYCTRLLSDNVGEQVVVDIGAHIGCFARLWHRKNPRAKIICVEACPENIEALRANVGEFSQVIQAACTYQPGPVALLNAVRPQCESTGGSTVVPAAQLHELIGRQLVYQYWEDSRELAKVTLEDVMRLAGVDRIDVLKLDCEGSEFSILENTTSLARIRIIVGEYHGKERWSHLLRRVLSDWDYGHMRDGEFGNFHLANRAWPPACDDDLDRHLASMKSRFHERDLLNWPNWLPQYRKLFEVARKLSPRTVCEIGVRAGYSAWTFLEACPEASVVGIDADADHFFPDALDHAEKILAGRRFRVIRSDSRDIDRLPESDLVYVDGDHLRGGCLHDLQLAAQATDTILVDDCGPGTEVQCACDAFIEAWPEFASEHISYGKCAFLLLRRPPGTPRRSSRPAIKLARNLREPPLLRVAVPAGIGDSLWALTKIPSMLAAYNAPRAKVCLCGGPPYRAKDFVERFDFIESADCSDYSCVESTITTPGGAYAWAPSQPNWHGTFDWMLQANSHLERGRRLESWFREFETDFKIGDRFWFTAHELKLARRLEADLGSYCVFYFGPETGNTTYGHNRGPLWVPGDWVALAAHCRQLGLRIVVVGADYDRSYFERWIVPAGFGECVDAIGRWPIGETFAVIQRSRFVVAYQSGIGIFCPYLEVPAAVFWRPYGNSLDPDRFVSFDERMASAWVPPNWSEYLPLIYTKCSPESITEHIVASKWHH